MQLREEKMTVFINNDGLRFNGAKAMYTIETISLTVHSFCAAFA